MRTLVNLLFTVICCVASFPAHAGFINCTGLPKKFEDALGSVCNAPTVYTAPDLAQTSPFVTSCDSIDLVTYNRIALTTLLSYIEMRSSIQISNLRPPRVCIVSFEELNNPQKFSMEHGRVVGRYRVRDGTIYATPAALKPGSTDLAHELVHHFNALEGITDPELDEEIAYAFEKRYASRY